jgi:hypothetical protein
VGCRLPLEGDLFFFRNRQTECFERTGIIVKVANAVDIAGGALKSSDRLKHRVGNSPS